MLQIYKCKNIYVLGFKLCIRVGGEALATYELLQRYFRSKTRQLLAACDQTACEHSGLIGSHRENIINIYLSDILPSRFKIGKGMIYGLTHKSKEVDIVLWDSQNFPKLDMQGHSLFFAESARLALEIKSNFSANTLNDIFDKSEAVRNIVSMSGPDMADEIDFLRQQLYAFMSGETFNGVLINKYSVATAAIIYKGGNTFGPDFIDEELLKNVDDKWPDIMILLEAGKVVLKQYEEENDSYLEFFDIGKDALLLFTSSLLGLLTERSVNIEDPFYLKKYAFQIFNKFTTTKVPFRLTRPIPGRRVIG